MQLIHIRLSFKSFFREQQKIVLHKFKYTFSANFAQLIRIIIYPQPKAQYIRPIYISPILVF